MARFALTCRYISRRLVARFRSHFTEHFGAAFERSRDISKALRVRGRGWKASF